MRVRDNAKNREHQKAYRARHLTSSDGGGERINMVVQLGAKRQLERLARHYAVSQKVMLERLLAEADKMVLAALKTVAAEQVYYDGK